MGKRQLATGSQLHGHEKIKVMYTFGSNEYTIFTYIIFYPDQSTSVCASGQSFNRELHSAQVWSSLIHDTHMSVGGVV